MTFFSAPRAAVTVMPSDGLTSATPFPGVIFTAEVSCFGLSVACGLDLEGTVPAAGTPRSEQRQHHHGGDTRELPQPPQPPNLRPIPVPDRDPFNGSHVSTRFPGMPVIR